MHTIIIQTISDFSCPSTGSRAMSDICDTNSPPEGCPRKKAKYGNGSLFPPSKTEEGPDVIPHLLQNKPDGNLKKHRFRNIWTFTSIQAPEVHSGLQASRSEPFSRAWRGFSQRWLSAPKLKELGSADWPAIASNLSKRGCSLLNPVYVESPLQVSMFPLAFHYR